MELAFLSPADMVVVMAIALIVFGPKKLPEVGRQIGGVVRELRKMVGQLNDTAEDVHSDIRGSFAELSQPPRNSNAGGLNGDLMKPYPALGATRLPEPLDQPRASVEPLAQAEVPARTCQDGAPE